jgi:methionyl aminopeptidase
VGSTGRRLTEAVSGIVSDGVGGLADRVRGRFVEMKTPGQVEAMRAAGLVVAATLAAVTEAAKPGVSTADLDEVAEATIRDAGAVPSFLGYQGFPASICTSVNEQVVHGIPAREQVLADGDLVSVDCGAILEGWHGDAAVTLLVGTPAAGDEELSAACRAAMEAGIATLVPGGRLGDVGHAIEEEARRRAGADGREYGIVADYGGHGIGTSMHMEPFVPNLGRAGSGMRLRTGMVLAIEPMLTAGTDETTELEDGWTVVTADGSRAAHWEHSVAVTDDGPRVLTAPAE